MTPFESSVDVMDAICRRRSVRSYRPGKLEWATIKALLTAAVRAPTAMHREPWEFVIVQDAELLKRLSERTRLIFADEPHPDMLDRGGHALDIFAAPDFDVFYGAGTLIVIGTRSDSPSAVADCWLAAQNLMLAAVATGLGTCVIGSAIAALNLPETKDELGVPADFTAIAPVVAGTPSGEMPPTLRREPSVLAWV